MDNNHRTKSEEEKLLTMHSNDNMDFSVKGTKISFSVINKPKINKFFSSKNVYKFNMSKHFVEVIISVINKKPIILPPNTIKDFPVIDWEYHLKFLKNEYIIPELYVLEYIGEVTYDNTEFGNPFKELEDNNKSYQRRFNDLDFYNKNSNHQLRLCNPENDCNLLCFLVLVQSLSVLKVYEQGYDKSTIYSTKDNPKDFKSTQDKQSDIKYIETSKNVDNYIEISKNNPYRLFPHFLATSKPHIIPIYYKIIGNEFVPIQNSLSNYLSKRHFRFIQDGYYDSSPIQGIDFTKVLK